ncbi:hypothetical protein BJV77DRAFT_966064 [Russula vinacea]|nr:hypothetical protein BJV77DRAFT_966064 [Russula vinacea]
MSGTSKADLYFEDETETTLLKGKSPDVSLMVIIAGEGSLSQYPTIAVKVGYSETYEMLKKDVEAWLLGSLSYVRCAILVKLKKPALDSNFSNINLWGGYIKVYHLVTSMLKLRVHVLMMRIHSNDEDYKVVKYGERINFLPPKQTIPKLSLLVGHFLPLKYFKEDIQNGSIDFKLDSLVQLCQWKIKQMIDKLKVKAEVPEKC